MDTILNILYWIFFVLGIIYVAAILLVAPDTRIPRVYWK
jgi:hypothetical protein